MPATANPRIQGAKVREASGNSGRQYRMKPKVPTLSSTPTSSTAPPIGASAPESGSQVWKGTSGALMAKATKNPRKSSFCTPGSMSSWRSASKAKVPSPSWELLTT